MFYLINLIIFLFVMLLNSFTMGCTGAEDGSAEALTDLEMPKWRPINANNIAEYVFEGMCPVNGEDNIMYTMSGMGREPLEGILSCVDNNWELPVPESELTGFEDGNIALVLASSDDESFTINVIKDTVAPIINSISKQEDDSWSWECDTSAPCDEYRTFINNSDNYEFPDPAPFSSVNQLAIPADWQSNGDQDFYIHVQAQDSAGNLSAVITSIAFRFDNIMPALASLITTNGTWSWSCNEANCEYHFVIDQSALPPASISQNYGPISSASPDSGPGTYYIHIQARDTYGNESSIVSTDTPIVITDPDTTPPQESGVSAVAGNYKRGDEIILSVIFLGSVIVTGTPELAISIGDDTSDIATFSGSAGEITMTIDFVYTVKANHNGGIMATSFVLDAGDKIEDEAHNPADVVFDRNFDVEGVNIDTIVPGLSGLANDAMPTTSKNWNFSCSEENCKYRFVVNSEENFTFTDQAYGLVDTVVESSGNGTRYLHVQAKDMAGNESQVFNASAIIDSTPPTVSIIAENNFWFWRCLDSYSCKYRLSVSEQESYSFGASDDYGVVTSAIPGSGTGPYYVYVQAKDLAGNESGIVKSTALFIEENDITAPEVVNASSEIGAYGVGKDLYITVTFSEPVTISNHSIDLRIEVGSASRNIALFGNPDELNISHQFRYTVGPGENGSIVATSLVVDNITNTIQDASGNNLVAAFTNITIADVVIDGIEPNLTLENDGVDWVWSCNEMCSYRYTVNQSSSYSFGDEDNYDTNLTSLSLSVEAGTSYLHIQARDMVGNESEVVSNAHYFVGLVGVRDIVKNGFGWSWGCAPIGDCETRFAVGKDLTPPAANEFSPYTDNIKQATTAMGRGTYYLHLQARERIANSNESIIHTSTETIVVKTQLWSSMSVGHGHTCALSDVPKCWGKNNHGQLGTNNTSSQSYPEYSVDSSQIPSDQFLQIYAGEGVSCALLLRSGGKKKVSCWGYGFDRELGYYKFGSEDRPSDYITGGLHIFENFNTTRKFNEIIDVSMGFNHSCALRLNGKVICWGIRVDGQLGDANAASLSIRSKPLLVKAAASDEGVTYLKNIMQVSAGYKHTCALRFNGAVYCWGNGDYGEIGNGAIDDKFRAQQVLRAEDTPLKGVVQIDAGDAFTCATRSNGTVWCWGKSSNGRRGGEISEWNTNYATQIGSLNNVSEVSVGGGHVCALKKVDGSVWCWGLDSSGQLGRGGKNSSDNAIPKRVLGQGGIAEIGPYLKGVSDVEVGGAVSCATGEFKGILCWGKGNAGQLGIGAIPNYVASPVHVLNNPASAVALTTNNFRPPYYCVEGDCSANEFSLALGQGSETPGTSAAPSVTVSGLESGESIKIYNSSDCSGAALQTINTNGSITLTANEGNNAFHFTKARENTEYSDCSKGPLAYDLDTTAPTVTRIDIPSGTYASGSQLDITVSFDELVGLTGSPQLSLTGASTASYLDHEYNRVTFRYIVEDNIDIAGLVLEMGVNLNGGSIFDDLDNSSAQLNLVSTNFPDVIIDSILPSITIDNLVALEISGLNANVTNYPLSGDCESNVSVVVNIPGVVPSELPCQFSRWTGNLDLSSIMPTEVIMLASQRDEWGNMGQAEGTISVGTFEQKLFYHQKLALTDRATCLVSADRYVYCWGVNPSGILGTGEEHNQTDIYPPRRVIDIGESVSSTNYLSNVVQITRARGDNFIFEGSNKPYFCAVVVDENVGKVRCWGSNFPYYAILGDNSYGDFYSSVPIAVKNGEEGELTNVVQVSSGINHSCALKSSGMVFCWGLHKDGRMGIGPDGEGDFSSREASSAVMTGPGGGPLSGIVQVKAGGFSSCVLDSSGKVWCWGREYHGELGDGGGALSVSAYPVQVRDYSGVENTALSNVVQLIGSEDNEFCALHSNNDLSCWGRMRQGYNYGSTTQPIRMREYSGHGEPGIDLVPIAQVGLGSYLGDGCLLEVAGRVRCWGQGEYGALGDGVYYGNSGGSYAIDHYKRRLAQFGQSR